MRRRRKNDDQFSATAAKTPYPGDRDSDQSWIRFWVVGVLYVNRNDPRLFVEKRSGLGWTINFAHPIAWWLAGGLFVLVGLLQLCFFLLFHSFINLVLLGVFLALLLLLFVGYLHVRTSEQA